MTDKPVPWWRYIPLTSSAIVNMHPEGASIGVVPDATPADTLTLRKLYDMARNLPKPHPLAGLDAVYYAENMRDAAHAFITEYNATGSLRPPIVATVSEYLPPGYIMGRRGSEIVLITRPEKE